MSKPEFVVMENPSIGQVLDLFGPEQLRQLKQAFITIEAEQVLFAFATTKETYKKLLKENKPPEIALASSLAILDSELLPPATRDHQLARQEYEDLSNKFFRTAVLFLLAQRFVVDIQEKEDVLKETNQATKH